MTRKSKTVTQEQRMIIEHSGSHALVKAVPGSGKTTTLVKRVQHLLKHGVRAGSYFLGNFVEIH